MATRLRLRNIKRQRREAINLQLESLKPLRPTTQRAPNQHKIRLPHCVLALSGTLCANRDRLRNINRQHRKPINFQLQSLKPLRPTTQRAPNHNTIRLPHGVLSLSGTLWPLGSAEETSSVNVESQSTFNLNPLSHSDSQPNKHPTNTQSGFRMAFLQLLALSGHS